MTDIQKLRQAECKVLKIMIRVQKLFSPIMKKVGKNYNAKDNINRTEV